MYFCHAPSYIWPHSYKQIHRHSKPYLLPSSIKAECALPIQLKGNPLPHLLYSLTSSHLLVIHFCYIQSIPRTTFWISEKIGLWRDNYPLDDIKMNDYLLENVWWFSHGLLYVVYMCLWVCVCVRKRDRERENVCA